MHEPKLDRQVAIPHLELGTQEAFAADIRLVTKYRDAFRRRGTVTRAQAVDTRFDDLRQMAALQDLFFQPHYVSHRFLVGTLICWLKKTTVRIANIVLKHSLVRQVELNQHSWNVALQLRLLEERVQKLEAQLEEVGRAP